MRKKRTISSLLLVVYIQTIRDCRCHLHKTLARIDLQSTLTIIFCDVQSREVQYEKQMFGVHPVTASTRDELYVPDSLYGTSCPTRVGSRPSHYPVTSVFHHTPTFQPDYPQILQMETELQYSEQSDICSMRHCRYGHPAIISSAQPIQDSRASVTAISTSVDDLSQPHLRKLLRSCLLGATVQAFICTTWTRTFLDYYCQSIIICQTFSFGRTRLTKIARQVSKFANKYSSL